MTTEPKHWILRDEHGCVLGAAVIHPHHLTEESAWESLAGDKRTPGMYLEKITSEQWDSEYRDRFGRCSGPSRPVAAVPAPVQGADPTGPREASWDEPPADATARRQWEEDVLKKAVAPTGPQEAHSDNVEPCDDCETKGRNCLAHRYRAERDDAREERDQARQGCRKLIDERDMYHAGLNRLHEIHAAERERADKAEAERDQLIEQGRKLGYDQAAEDMTPLVQAGYETGRRDALDEILSHDDGDHGWSIPDVVLLARGGEQAVDNANDPAGARSDVGTEFVQQCEAIDRGELDGHLADLQAELDHLEATDPAVADAAARYDAMSAKIRSRPLSCGCPPEHHDEAKRRLADTMRRDGVITEED